MIKNKKILVYDNQHYFARFLKLRFDKKFDFVVFNKFKEQDEFNSIEKEFDFIFFVIYSDTDLYAFIKVYGKGIPVIVASHNKEILRKMNHIEDVSVFDASLTKSEMADNINSLFDMYNLPNEKDWLGLW
jgi:hypothetical protein